MTFTPPVPQLIGQPGVLEAVGTVANASAGGEDTVANWVAVFRKLEALAAVGGFATDAPGGVFGRLDLWVAERKAPDQLVARFRAVDLHGFAAHAVSRTVTAFHLQAQDLKRASLIVPVSWPISAWPLCDRDRLPFAFVDDRRSLRGGMDLLLRARREVSATDADRAEDAYGAWFSCANLGVFADEPMASPSTFILPGGEALVDGRHLLIQTGDYLFAEPLAIDALLNVLCWVHSNLAPLDSVSLADLDDLA